MNSWSTAGTDLCSRETIQPGTFRCSAGAEGAETGVDSALTPHLPPRIAKGRGYRRRDGRDEHLLKEMKDKLLLEESEVLHLPQEARRIPH